MSRDDIVKMCVDILGAKPSDACMDNPLCDLKMSKAGPYPAFPDKAGTMDRLIKLLGYNAPDKLELGTSDALTAVLAKARGA